MRVSIIIPVWNGDTVITNCLDAIYAHSGEALREIICVENASRDESADRLAVYPQPVRVLPQSVNLGFAGGVNVGINAAAGDVAILVNQDCAVQPGWLDALLAAFAQNPTWGIAGCTILEADGTVNHTGAELQLPTAHSRHLTVYPDHELPQTAVYVTGTVFAIRREVWESIGLFDEGFYPAYYEESDYCYRARQHGFETGYVPKAQAVHFFSSREWQTDPVKHNANQHRARYRFVVKHFDEADWLSFFSGEKTAVSQESYFDQTIGQCLAARDTLRQLPEILTARQRDLQDTTSPYQRRLLQAGFTDIWRTALAQSGTLAIPSADMGTTWQQAKNDLDALRNAEYELVSRIYFRHPKSNIPESQAQRLWRLLVKRPISFITLRDYFLQAKLNTLHVSRLDQMALVQHLDVQRMEQRLQARLKILELLTEYDYR